MPIARACTFQLPCFPGTFAVVVHALRDENRIREAKVHSERNHGWHETSPYSSEQIGQIADEPDEEEFQGDGLGILGLIVFNELRDLVIEISICHAPKRRRYIIFIRVGRPRMRAIWSRKRQTAPPARPRQSVRALWEVYLEIRDGSL